MNFKIGNKVKLCNIQQGEYECVDNHIYTEDIIGTVIEIGRSIHIEWDTNKCVICGDGNCGMLVKDWYHNSHEIEKVSTKGEQLLFEFMK